jgi:hypothetical protein
MTTRWGWILGLVTAVAAAGTACSGTGATGGENDGGKDGETDATLKRDGSSPHMDATTNERTSTSDVAGDVPTVPDVVDEHSADVSVSDGGLDALVKTDACVVPCEFVDGSTRCFSACVDLTFFCPPGTEPSIAQLPSAVEAGGTYEYCQPLPGVFPPPSFDAGIPKDFTCFCCQPEFK